MTDVYTPNWVEKYWKLIQLVVILSAIFLVASVFWFLSIGPVGLFSYAVMIIYIVFSSSPPGGTAKQRFDRDKHRLSLYIQIIEDVISVSENPLETFQDLISHFVSIKRFSESDLSLIISHFAGRADEIGQEVRRLVREEEAS